MALKKTKTLDSGITCEYHTPVIMQDNAKHTTIAVSTFVNEQAYLDGKKPVISREVFGKMDSKYPTADEIYSFLKASQMSEEEKDEDGNVTKEAEETNWFADAEDC